MATAYCNVEYLGKNVLTELKTVITLDVKTRKEQSYYMKLEDSEETIDYSDLSNIALIAFESDHPFSIKFTKDTNIITIPVKDVFLLRPNAMTGFTSIKLASLYATSHYIHVRFYGE